MVFELFSSLLLNERGVLNCFRHFYKASEVFCIVYVTFIKRAMCFELFALIL